MQNVGFLISDEVHFMIANTVVSLISDSMSEEMPLMCKENNKGPRAVPCGTLDTKEAQSYLTLFRVYS